VKGVSKVLSYEHLGRFLCKRDWTPIDEAYVLELPTKERAFLASNITYDGLLIDLSYDPDETVRNCVASNICTPKNVLTRISHSDQSQLVRKTALKTLEDLQ